VSITRQAIDKDRVTWTILILLAAGGISAFFSLPQSEDPGFVVRTAVVQTVFPGASPERVEQLVTDKLEKVIQEIPELDSVTSQSKTGVSLIWVNISEESVDMRPIWDKLRRKVDKARPDLPEGLIGPTVNDEFGDVFGIVLTLTGDGFDEREIREVADEVRDELLLLSDVAKVEIFGAQDERVFIEFDDAQLVRHGISPGQLRQALATTNIIIPGGSIDLGLEKIAIEPSGNLASVEALRNTVLQVPGRPEILYLRDVADVVRGTIDPPRSLVHSRAGRALALAVSMREGGNIVELGEELEPVIERLRAHYPIGIELETVLFQPEIVSELVDGFVISLLQAVGIVTLVMLLSLGFRTGMVVATLIPMAMLTTLLMMSVFGIGLDQMSIASLIIALGMLVDNAIVMSESIMVSMQAGKAPVEAAVESASELRIPLLTSSLTTAAAFLPIYLAESAVGEYTAPLFKVVTITLLASWGLSITMVPMLCARFLRVSGAGAPTFEGRFYRGYRGAIRACLRQRVLTMGVVAGAFAAAIYGFSLVPNLFFPPNDRATFTVELELPLGTPIGRTVEAVEEVEALLRAELLADPESGRDGVTSWVTFIGNGGPKFALSYNPGLASPEYAILIANASSRELVDEAVVRIEDFANRRFPEVQTTARPLSNGPPAWPPVEVRISGRDSDVLFELVDRVQERLAATPGTRRVEDDWGPRAKKLVVEIAEDRARRAGVTNQDVAVSLQTYFDGIEVTEYREGEDLIPVVLRSSAAERTDLSKLDTLNVFSQATGRSVPIRQVADVEVVWEPAQVRRRDRLRTVAVQAGLDPGVTASEVVAAIRPWLEEEDDSWGLGSSWEIGGEVESSGAANASIAAQLPLAGMIIVLLLVVQFNSLRRPTIILVTVPLGLIGVVVGLLLVGSYFGFMTLLGIISLAGIVINNAIVLLDRIRIEIEDNGLPPGRAIVEAAQQRLRPILLTTATTVLGLLPLWWGGGAMWEPMAVAIIFGLLFATLLTLVVVPVFYALFFRVEVVPS